nr:MAG TPA: hypothetical protein [Caudoviricetes sp.]
MSSCDGEKGSGSFSYVAPLKLSLVQSQTPS